jgi:aminoglycoside phosphotransferase (APT) family kinase protein
MVNQRTRNVTTIMNENQIERLTEYYNQNYPKTQTISDVKEITDGWETKLFRYTVNYVLNEKKVSDQQVIRIFSDHGGPTSEKEFHVMMKLMEQGYPVPEVFHNDSTGDVIGKPFIIMEYLSGNTLNHRINNVSDSEREVLNRQMIELMVDLHGLKVSNVFPDNKLKDTGDYLDFMFNQIDERIAWTKLDWVYPIVDWLKERGNDVETHELSVLHGDFHGSNIMFRGDGSLSVIDWSGSNVGDYRFDLAWTIILFSTFGGSFFRDLLLNMYSEVSGSEIKDIEYFEVLGCAVRLVIVFSSFLNKPDEMGYRSKSEKMTPDISDHWLKVYDMLVKRTGLKLPDFEKIMST